MTSTPDEQSQADRTQPDSDKEGAGVELGLSDEGTTFEPEEDPEAAD